MAKKIEIHAVRTKRDGKNKHQFPRTGKIDGQLPDPMDFLYPDTFIIRHRHRNVDSKRR